MVLLANSKIGAGGREDETMTRSNDLDNADMQPNADIEDKRRYAYKTQISKVTQIKTFTPKYAVDHHRKSEPGEYSPWGDWSDSDVGSFETGI